MRTAVITGASSGIGKVAAHALAVQGWRVIGLGRDPVRTTKAQDDIRAAAPRARVDFIRGDLSIMKEAAQAATDIAMATDYIDVLLNNAGGVQKERVITDEGFEATFASNHLGHFVLTTRLLTLLRSTARSSARGDTRIISVSSSGHERSPGLDWNDLQKIRDFTTGGAYTNAKLANILFTRALAKRVIADGIVAHAMHPGVVDSNFASHADAQMQQYIATLKGISLSPEAGADTLFWLATAPEPGQTTGGYFYNRAPLAPSAAAQDDEAADRLWTVSEALVAKALA